MSKERRRSPRLEIRVLVHAAWKDRKGAAIVRDAVTVSINAHGALLKLLSESRPAGQIVLENMANHEVQKGRIVNVSSVHNEAGAYMVSVEFQESAPQFWGRVYLYSNQGLELMHVHESLLGDPLRGSATPKAGRL